MCELVKATHSVIVAYAHTETQLIVGLDIVILLPYCCVLLQLAFGFPKEVHNTIGRHRNIDTNFPQSCQDYLFYPYNHCRVGIINVLCHFSTILLGCYCLISKSSQVIYLLIKAHCAEDAIHYRLELIAKQFCKSQVSHNFV